MFDKYLSRKILVELILLLKEDHLQKATHTQFAMDMIIMRFAPDLF